MVWGASEREGPGGFLGINTPHHVLRYKIESPRSDHEGHDSNILCFELLRDVPGLCVTMIVNKLVEWSAVR